MGTGVNLTIKINWPLALIGVDPGVTTGWAILKLSDPDSEPVLLDCGQWVEQWDVWKTLDAKAQLLEELGFNVILVVEQFDQRPGIVNPDMTPKYINNDIENNLVGKWEVVWQIPAMAKTLVPQAKRGVPDALKRFGWYQTSHRHANDAIRHVITHATHKLRHMPLIRRGWPEPKEDND